MKALVLHSALLLAMGSFTLLPRGPASASSPPADSVHVCASGDHEHWRRDHRPPATKPLADLDVGQARTVRLFYFLPNDRPLREDVVQRTKDEMVRVQAWFGQQMEAHGYGYTTFRVETDDQGVPVVHRVDGQHPDSHYIDGTWAAVNEVGRAFDLSKSISVVVVDISTNRINRTAAGSATGGRVSGNLLVPGGFAWHTLAHELGHTFGMGHDFRDERYIMSYGIGSSRRSLSACSAGILAVHPYFNPAVGVEWAEAPLIELLSATTYPEGAESVPIRLRVSDPDGLQQVRVRVRTRETHDPRFPVGGTELKTCRDLMGEKEAVVEIAYDGVIPSGRAHGSDLSNPKVHPISLNVTDRDFNRAAIAFDLWEVSRQHLATFDLAEQTQGGGVTAVALSADDATLASGFVSGQVQLLDLEGGRVIATLPAHTHPVLSLAFSPDGAVLASAAPDGIRLWDVAAQTRSATLPVGAGSVAFSADGATLVSGSEDGVRLWKVETQTEVISFSQSWGRWGFGGNAVAFAPDGILLAAGGDNTTVRLWEVATDEVVAVLEGHDRPVRSVAFSADGNLVASGADLGVNLWDPGTKERLVTLQGEGRGINTVALSPDGTTLASGTEDGKVDLWDVSEWLRPRPGRLLMVSGDDQQGTSGEPLAGPFVVEVRDQYGNPLPGEQVIFAVTEGDGQLAGRFTLERITSDANGRAETILTLGPAEGTNTVEASVAGLEVVSFSASAAGDAVTPRMEGDSHTWRLPDGATARLGKGRITAVAFSPTGELLAVGTYAGVWLYDVATSREVALLPSLRVFDIAFSPDGRTLASRSYPAIHLWKVATGTRMATLGPGDGVGGSGEPAVAFSPDGRILASGSYSGIRLWEVATGTRMATIDHRANSVAFSPDGRTVASASAHRVRLWEWDVATGTTVTFEGHTDRVRDVSFSPDGRTVASASYDYTVRLWDVATGSATTLEGHESWVETVSFSPDGRTVASGSVDGTVRLWDVATSQSVTLGGGGWVKSVSFSPDGRTVASGASDVRLWDVASGSGSTIARQHVGAPRSVALSPDGTTLASTTSREILLWDVAAGRMTTLSGHTGIVRSVAFSPDGATLASGSESDPMIRLWDAAAGTEIATLEALGHDWTAGLTFSADGRMIASGHGGPVKVWDLATRENTVTFDAAPANAAYTIIEAMAFSPDASALATGAVDALSPASGAWGGLFGVWDLASGTALVRQKLSKRIQAVSFAPNGTARAFGWPLDPNLPASIWEAPAGASAATLSLELPASSLGGASFSPDGSILLSGGHGLGVEVWEVATGTLIAALKGHGDHVEPVAFSRDGSTFASGGVDGTILVWDLRLVLPHPRTLAGLSGDGQEGLPNAALDEPLVVVVSDQNGNPFAGAQVTFAVTGGGGTVSVEAATTDARGQASSTLTVGLAPGPNTVEVTVGDLEPVIFTARTRSIPTTLAKVGGDSQQGLSGTPLAEPLMVSLLDQGGTPHAGEAVTFAVTAGGGTLSVTRAVTDAQGRASSALTLGRTPGANAVRVTAAGLAPVTFTAIGVVIPRTLAKHSGDDQAAGPGAQLAEPLVVSVLDQNGSAFPGAVVTFAVLGDGGILTAVSDTTDAEGLAATALTLGEEFGTYTVVATAADIEPVTFTATAKASPDFDEDGEVGFSDFFLLAHAFGGSDPRFDLDASGTVDFADFFLFAEHFGQPARAKLMALARERVGLPAGPQLRQNAPNPFNSGTALSWFQLRSGPARLEVFALNGQRVAVLHEGPRKAGLHRLRWDGRDDRGRPLASGVYVYRLVTAEAVQTRKLTLLR